MKIAIVEDAEELAILLSEHFRNLGHETVVARSAEGACEAIAHRGECPRSERCADMGFIDYSLPGINGVEFIRYMLTHGCHGLARHKVLMTASVLGEEELDEIRRLGFSRVISKPFDFGEVERVIAKVEKELEAGATGNGPAAYPEGRRKGLGRVAEA